MFTSSILGNLKYKNSCVGWKSFLVSIYFRLNRKGKLLLPTVGEAIALLESGTSFVLPSPGTMSVLCSMPISDRLLEGVSVSQFERVEICFQ